MAASFKAQVLDTGSGALRRFRKGMITPRAALILGRQARGVIIQRTLKGLDENGVPFASYSKKEYRAPIARRPVGYPKPRGGRAKGLGSRSKQRLKNMVFAAGYGSYKVGIGRPAGVQLSVSNQMLQDIQVEPKAKGRKVVLFFFSARSRAIAHGHQTGANNLPVREFFGFGDTKSTKELVDQYQTLMKELKKKARL